MDNSTNTASPVNQIADLLTNLPEGEKKPVEESKKLDNDDVALAGDEGLQEPTDSTDEPIDGEGDVTSLAAKEDDENKDGGEDIDTLNNLAEELDVPVADLYALNISMAEGENKTLGELKDFYSANKDVEGLRANILEKETSLATQSEAMKRAPQISNDMVEARATLLSINSQYNSVDWEALRQSNPGQYAALQTDFRTAFQEAQSVEEQAKTSYGEHQDQNALFQQDRLFKAIPELKDDTVRAQAAQDITALAKSYGFSEQEIGNIEDSRLMHLLIDASKGFNAKSSVKDKKVEAVVPKAGKPAGRKPTSTGRNASLKRLTERAKRTGDRRDKVNAVSALIS